MKWITRSMAAVAVGLLVLPSCKKKHDDRVASDLEEAGYQITAEDWFRATRQNDVAAMRKFASAGFSLDTRDGEGDAALHAAATAGAIEAADFLLDRKVPVDVRGKAERTPLMAAVIANQPKMAAWLLRQGADPTLKDQDGFKPLMLAAREGGARCIGELAARDREDLDGALLLAAMEGRADVIDALTKYGASVYARMEDGRTPLMIAAENGHSDAARLLVDLGSSRYATDEDGRSTAEIATSAGFPEIAEIVLHDPSPEPLGLESPEEIAGDMDAFVDRAAGQSGEARPERAPHDAPRSIQGEVLSRVAAGGDEPAGGKPAPFAMPPLVMRHYRERDAPIGVATVKGDAATFRIAGKPPREVKARVGETIPGSNLMVVRVHRRMEESKVTAGKPVEISVVEVKDRTSGVSREWIAGFPSAAHDPVALVEDAATGRRYLASPGQRFRAEDGGEYLVSEVRPNQLVIREVETGQVRTIALHGPRG